MSTTSPFPVKRYYEVVVLPTVQEFYSKKNDRRLCMLACMALLHVVDHVFHSRASSDADAAVQAYNKKKSDENVAFAAVRAFALASKHAVVNNKFKPGFTTNNIRIRRPSISGRMIAGATFIGDRVGGITIEWEEHRHINLTKAIQATIRLFEADFPELTADEAVGSGVSGPS